MKRLVAWAAQECAWQKSGEASVSRLIHAWDYLMPLDEIHQQVARDLGYIVEPQKNHLNAWRSYRVVVGTSMKPDPREVPRLMDQLFEHGGELTPTEWYREFEEIHPFADGNGRVGALIFNHMSDTLEPMKIQFPPNLWNDPRREDLSPEKVSW
jgi:Fic family protein